MGDLSDAKVSVKKYKIPTELKTKIISMMRTIEKILENGWMKFGLLKIKLLMI